MLTVSGNVIVFVTQA